MKERSLVVFTLLTQLAIGAFWTQSLLSLWAVAYTNLETARLLTVPAFLGIVPVMVAALLISLSHLGTPLNAWRAAANLRSSWLSREIVFTLLFTLLEAAFAWTFWQQIGEQWLWLLLGLGAALAGGLALYSMTRLYMLRTIESWNTWVTPASFLTSTLLLGSLAAGVELALNPAAESALLRLPLTWIGLAAVFLLGTRLVITTLNAGGETPIWIAAQVSLTVFALSISSMLLYQSAVFELSGGSAALSWLVVLAFLGALAEEAIGRFLFYLSFERAGI
jgi:anaerobic dimethyl sulfoxide reductase subunit C (anchor subunit)